MSAATSTRGDVPKIDEPAAAPFLKWVGGKRSLLPRMLAHTPKNIRTYHEVFVGGGAFFFALQAEKRFQKARLNDANERLMRTYKAVQGDVEGLIRRLRRMPNEADFFAKIRRKKIDTEVHSAVAAWMIYLNKTCYNGLYRVNLKGEFNSPFGRYASPLICDAENLRAAARALDGVKLSNEDFMYAALHAKKGDFVFADPPYLVRVGKEFTGYTEGGFTHKDHERLRNTMWDLKTAGVHVMITNSGTDEVRELYSGFNIEEVFVRRSVGADATSRGKVPDFIIT